MMHSYSPTPNGQGGSRQSTTRRGFTLIELLIVVAIIAILAAIAVPNFLEAQVRAKVSRTKTDMRTMKTAVESYIVDNNEYPETDTGIVNKNNGYLSYLRLTSPIAYISAIPRSPWLEVYGGDKLATDMNSYLYVRAITDDITADTNPNNGFSDDYEQDRAQYIIQGALLPLAERTAIQTSGGYLFKSVGPNNVDDRDTSNPDAVTPARLYDPTNGTLSGGDIIAFGDQRGSLR